MQYPHKYRAKKVMKLQVLKVEITNPIYDSSNNVNYVVSHYINIYRKAGQDIAGKTEFVTVKTV